MQKNECPCCKSNLEIKQINFEEAVLICTNLKCPYPLDGKVEIYKRKLKDVHLNILSLCANEEIWNGADNNSNKGKDIRRQTILHEVPQIPHEGTTSHMTNFKYHILESNNSENQDGDSETIVNVIIEEPNDTNSNGENTNNDVLEIEVEIDSVSQEVILKKVQEHPNIKNECVTLIEENIDSLIDAKIDELLKDADISSIASVETMNEDIDWLTDLLEI